ncbi:hypothetical protein NMG60_11034258 [Bertholletia excelsa]
MMQPELQDSPCFQDLHMDSVMENCGFSSSILSSSSEVSASIPNVSREYNESSNSFPIYDWLNLEESSINSSQDLSFDGSENGLEFSETSPSAQQPLVFPAEDQDVDDDVGILHLLRACGEAMEKEQQELLEVILKRLEEKAHPKGSAFQRLIYYLTQSLDGRLDYLTQEASKNFHVAFRAFYQIFPYGRFAHFVANSAILRAMPEEAEVILIVDFDMGEGLQWPTLIESLSRKQRRRSVRLISVNHNEWNNFKRTKKLLCEQAFCSGLKLEVEQMGMEELRSEMKKMKKNGGRREWFAFNIMGDLPHQVKQRSVTQISEFLILASEALIHFDRSIVTVGDGNVSHLGSLFEGQLGRITALLESMEWQFPLELEEARMAMESLFVVPSVCSLASFEKLEERARLSRVMAKMGSGLGKWRMSRDSIEEARELVREGDSLYWIRTEGENQNQAVLCFLGAPLVRVSCWCS